MQPDIQDDDYVISHRENFDIRLAEIVDEMNFDKFWPNVWFINDHGNVDLLAVNAETGKYTVVQSWV